MNYLVMSSLHALQKRLPAVFPLDSTYTRNQLRD